MLPKRGPVFLNKYYGYKKLLKRGGHSRRMTLDEDFCDFIESPVMIIIGTRSADNVPEIARGVGIEVDRATGSLSLLMSAWQWPETAANLETGAPVAITLARPSDYVSYQLKGTVTAMQPAGQADEALARRYIATMSAVLSGLGLDTMLAEPWQTDRELLRVGIAVGQVFLQTPGPQAGRLLKADA
jgi:hypothetical protein